MLKKVLTRAGIGFLIGALVGDFIAFLAGTSSTEGVTFASRQLLDMSGGNAIIAMILQSVFSGLYGAACFAGMSLYDADRLPLAAATALHCGLIVLPFIPISYLLGWVGGVLETVIIAAAQIAAFFMIWLILYFVYKKQVKELNDMQKQFSQKENDDN